MRRGRYERESPRDQTCEQCGTPFRCGRRSAKTCSDRCRKRRARGLPPERPEQEREREPCSRGAKRDKDSHLDQVFNKRTISVTLCWEILGGKETNLEGLKKRYRDYSKANHPDRGGDLHAMKRGGVAYNYLLPLF